MSKYNTDLDYVILDIDISREELEEIKTEAGKIISENKGNPKELAIAYLKKAQCLQKLDKFNDKYIYVKENYINIYMEKQFEIKGLLEKVLELSPDMPEALMRLSTTYNNINHHDGHSYVDKAMILINKAIQIKPDYAAALNNRSAMYDTKRHDNIRRAIDDLTKAIKIRPFDAVYHLNRGIFHSKLRQHKEAIEDFSRAINYASDILKGKLFINISIPSLGEEYEKTINCYSKTVNCDSDVFENLANIHFLRGVENMELKEYDKAIVDFSESLKDLDHDITLLLRGKAYYFAGKKDKAKADFDEYKNRKHNDVNATIHREFLNLFDGIDIHKEISFFSDYIHELSVEEYNKLPTFQEYLKNLEAQ